MNLDYRPKLEGQQVPPIEQLPFFSNKASDQYSSFINMQNVVNAALQKQAYQPNPNDKTELTVASGERYNV